MTNAERLEKMREAMGELDFSTCDREDRKEEILQIIAEELIKVNEYLEKNSIKF